MPVVGLFLVFIAFAIQASMSSDHQEGRTFAGTVGPQVQQRLLRIRPSEVPGFKTDRPAETGLDPAGNFTQAIQSTLKDHEAGSQVIDNAKIRPRVVIDPATDPLFQGRSRQSLEAKLAIPTKPKATPAKSPVEKTCEEGGEAVVYECMDNRYVKPQVPLKTATLWVNHLSFQPRMVQDVIKKKGKWNKHGSVKYRKRQDGFTLTLARDIKAFKHAFCPTFTGIDAKTKEVFPIDCSRIEGYQLNPATSVSTAADTVSIVTSEAMVNITLKHRTYEGEAIDEWRSNCEAFDRMLEEGLCHYEDRILIQGPGTRMIEGYAITKDAWQYRQRYRCQMIKDECSPLRAQGCYQTDSRCKERRQGKCWIFEQRYQCPSSKHSGPRFLSPPLEAFCLTGDCHDSSYEANKDMLEAFSRLSVLKQVQDDIHDKKGNFEIFKGEPKMCSRHCLNFKDCCGGLKGWGVSLKFSGCDKDEKRLSELRSKNLCHPVGTFCSSKMLKQCRIKKSSFCCFGSRMARLVQEQGRAQLKLSWGTAREPQCQGFRVDQFSRLDLSNMNFSEIFEEMLQKYRQPDMKALQQRTQESFQNNFKAIEQGLREKTIGPSSGKLHDDQNH